MNINFNFASLTSKYNLMSQMLGTKNQSSSLSNLSNVKRSSVSGSSLDVSV